MGVFPFVDGFLNGRSVKDIAFYPAPIVVCANYGTTTLNTQKMRVVRIGHSPNRIPTKLLPFTILAVLPNPNLIKLVQGLLDQLGIVGEYAGLKVTRTLAFHADACTCEVGAANIGHLAIEDQNFEVCCHSNCFLINHH